MRYSAISARRSFWIDDQIFRSDRAGGILDFVHASLSSVSPLQASYLSILDEWYIAQMPYDKKLRCRYYN